MFVGVGSPSAAIAIILDSLIDDTVLSSMLLAAETKDKGEGADLKLFASIRKPPPPIAATSPSVVCRSEKKAPAPADG